MALQISPSQAQFESVERPSQIEISLNNECSNTVTYRFRLQSKAITISHPKGTIDKQQTKTITVFYNPALNEIQDILLSMQIKSSELIDGKPGKEYTNLVPIRFLAEKDMEDDMFKSPMVSKSGDMTPPPGGAQWWKKLS